jgi:putative Ca2+/H+ antiporter (TMEM165/GDT1 family)
MIEDVLIPLTAVGLAELGDKTQLSILLLSSKTKKHLHLLLGVMIGFLVVDGFSVSLGSWIANILPTNLLKIVSGTIFIIFGVLVLGENEVESKGEFYFKNSFL